MSFKRDILKKAAQKKNLVCTLESPSTVEPHCNEALSADCCISLVFRFLMSGGTVDSAHCSENSIEKLEKLSSSTLVNHKPDPTFVLNLRCLNKGASDVVVLICGWPHVQVKQNLTSQKNAKLKVVTLTQHFY